MKARVFRSPGTEIIGGCELHGMGAGNHVGTWVLWKRDMHS